MIGAMVCRTSSRDAGKGSPRRRAELADPSGRTEVLLRAEVLQEGG